MACSHAQPTLTPVFSALPADVLWTLAMACNVYLTFFRKYNQHQLRSLEPKYFVACYGVPAIVAFVFLGLTTADKGRVYGPAVVSARESLC